MISRLVVSQSRPFPLVLKYTDIRSYGFTFVFILLSLLIPWAFHQFHLAGATFLPMHIFVLVAGLLFGWRAGLVVGLLTPLMSNVISGMPVLQILPQVVVELSAYGLIAGLLRQRFNLRVIWSLLGAMIGGRLALFLMILTIYLITGESYSPLGVETSTILSVWSIIRQGWPGMAIQLVFIPIAIWLVAKLARKKERDSHY